MSYLYSFVVYLYVNGGGLISSVGGGSWFVCCCLPVVVWFVFGGPLPLGASGGLLVLLWRSLGLPCGYFSKYITIL